MARVERLTSTAVELSQEDDTSLERQNGARGGQLWREFRGKLIVQIGSAKILYLFQLIKCFWFLDLQRQSSIAACARTRSTSLYYQIPSEDQHAFLGTKHSWALWNRKGVVLPISRSRLQILYDSQS